MNDEDIDRIIAERCGWTWIRLGVNCLVGYHEEWGTQPAVVPQYTADLNAIYEAEKHLLPCEWPQYITCLNSRHELGALVHQTARFKAEAYVRAIMKWKDAQP